ncbi:MAG TPA: hypothetical protein VGO45_11145 [Bacteroidia bacterium]|nr:hypothetical protein [Bacteroidia bacterium]
MKEFNYKFLIFTILVAVLLGCWNALTPPVFHNSISWFIFIFFALVTYGVHFLLVRASENKPQIFVNRFMGLTALKLFIYFLFLIVVFLTDRDHARITALYFLSMYFLFTVFEISSLYRKLRK